MNKVLNVSLFLSDGYSLLDVASVAQKLSLANRTQVVWHIHALEPGPRPAEGLGYAPQKLSALTSSHSTDLVVLALPQSDSRSAACAIKELTRAGISWRALILLGAPAPGNISGTVLAGEAARVAMDALKFFELPFYEGAAWSDLDPFELIAVEPTELSDLVKEALKLMACFVDEPLAIEALAKELKVGPRLLHRRFTQEVGEAPQSAYRRLRVEVGRRLLEQSDTPVTTIAHACGFADGPHFARSFQKIHQCAPQAYRRSYAGNQPAQPDGPTVKLSVVGIQNHTYKCSYALEEYARRVRARTHGQLHISVLTQNDLNVRPHETLQAVEQGAADAVFVVPEICSGDPYFAGLCPQGLLHSASLNNDLRRVQEPILVEALKRRRMSILSTFSDYEFQNFWFFSRFPVNSIDDLVGCTLGHWSTLGVNSFRALNVKAHKASYSSLYELLARGELDMMLGLPKTAVSRGLAKVAPYGTPAMAVTRQYPNVIAATDEVVSRLPKAHLAVLRDVGESMRFETEVQWQAGQEDQLSLSQLRREGMVFHERLEHSALQIIQDSMLSEWAKQCDQMGRKGRGFTNVRSALT